MRLFDNINVKPFNVIIHHASARRTQDCARDIRTNYSSMGSLDCLAAGGWARNCELVMRTVNSVAKK